jgi:hypothetical protein
MSTLNRSRRVPSGISTRPWKVGRKALLLITLAVQTLTARAAQTPIARWGVGPDTPTFYPYPGPVNLRAARLGSGRGAFTGYPAPAYGYGLPAAPHVGGPRWTR